MPLYRFHDFALDVEQYQLSRAGQIIEVRPRLFDLLLYLIRHPRKTIPKSELMGEVWHAEAVSNSSIPTAIAALRQTLGDDPDNPRFIETIRRRGYRFIAEVTTHNDALDATGTASNISRLSKSFVGRQMEMTSLLGSFEQSLAGSTQTILLLGEAGIGKTRITEEFIFSAERRGALTLVGRCREDAGAPAFWPWVQILRNYLDRCSTDALVDLEPHAAVISQILPEVNRLFPDLTPIPDVGAERARFRLLDAVTNFVQSTAKHRALVVVIDDLHRADTASLLLLEFLVRELRNSPVLIIGAYRDLELEGDPARKASLTRIASSAATRSIQLKGLSRESISELIEQPPEAGVVGALFEQSGGNPFFLTHLVQALEVSPSSFGSNSPEGWRFDLPAGVRDAIASQLAALPETTRETMEAAAAIGRDFSVSLLARTLDETVPEILDQLAAAKTARLVEVRPASPGSYRFCHALLRDVAYEQVSARRRSSYHQKIGEALESTHAPALDSCIEDLAFHFSESAGHGDVEKAISYCMAAGHHAAMRVAHENAPGYFQRALELTAFQSDSDPRLRCELLIQLGSAEMRIGRREPAKEALRQAAHLARKIEAPVLLTAAALSMAPGFFSIEVGVSDPELAGFLSETLALLPDSNIEFRAQVTARLAMDAVWSNSPQRCEKLSGAAVDLARTTSDPATKASALSARHGALWGAENIRERHALIREIGELAQNAGNAEITLMYRVLSITALLETGEILTADQNIVEYTKLAHDLQLPHAQWYVKLFHAMRALMKGEYQAASLSAQQFLELGNRVKDKNAPQSFGAHLMQTRWEQGRLHEITGVVENFVLEYPAILAWKCVLLFCHSEINHPEAPATMKVMAKQRFEGIPQNETWAIAIYMLCNACLNLRDTESASLLYDLYLPGEMHFTIVGYGVMYWGSRARELGNLASLMGRFDEAEEHLELAVSQNSKTGSVPWVAHSQYDLARMLIRRGDPKDRRRARELAEAAHRTACRLPMEKLKLDTAELLK